jgi:hypothetical protein
MIKKIIQHGKNQHIMGSKTAFKTLEDFLFQENKTFVIPNYQRGYKWAVKEDEKTASAVEKLLDNLISANKEQSYFLQGVTVVENNDKIILIDGQQRTTTFYFLLWCLSKELINTIKLEYDVRQQSKEFILQLKKDGFDYESFDKEDRNQDVYYFKQAIRQIESKIESIRKSDSKLNDFIRFILTKITILYIVIGQDKATKTFTMMNGSKATMLQEELVKAEMLRRISLPDFREKQVSTSVDENLTDLKEIIAKDWETNALRSRYAREWDKWLYWWNREDVKNFFTIEKPMGLLLDYYHFKQKENNEIEKFTFDSFRNLLLEHEKESEKQRTKIVFKDLRDIQKSIEDVFITPLIHNYLGLALIYSSSDKLQIISYFIKYKNDEQKLLEYAKFKLVGATHLEIIEKDDALFSKPIDVLKSLEHNFVYNDQYSIGCKYLLYLNVKEDIHLNRKFDFKIWKSKSLEHIFPKSKVYHINEQGELADGNNTVLSEVKKTAINDGSWLNRADFGNNGTEHCIGNLVMLYGNNNSEFGAKMVNEKKQTYFNIHEKFESRHLLHTISVFAQDSWGITEIQKNKNEIIKRFKVDYKIQNEDAK